MVPPHKDPGKSPQKESVVGRRTFQKKTCLKALSHTFFKNSAVEHIRVQRRFSILANKHSSALNTLSARCSCTSPVYAIDLLEVGTPLPASGLARTPDESTRAQMDGLRPSDAERSAAASSGD